MVSWQNGPVWAAAPEHCLEHWVKRKILQLGGLTLLNLGGLIGRIKRKTFGGNQLGGLTLLNLWSSVGRINIAVAWEEHLQFELKKTSLRGFNMIQPKSVECELWEDLG